MPEFQPFCGIRFDPTKTEIGKVTAPPYDVIDAPERLRLIRRDPHNVVQVDLPDEADGPRRYDAAARCLADWLEEGILVRDERPSFYGYRMDYTDDQGRPAHTVGVLGALRLSEPGDGDIRPHEHTTPKAKTDRLELLRATRTNLSAIWGLSLSAGLTELCRVGDAPPSSWTDDDGVTHRLWTIDDPDECSRIATSVADSPVVVADGHHRYETSLTYLDERRAAGDAVEGAEFALFYVVELTDTELTVRPIHRLVSGASIGDLERHLKRSFVLEDAGTVDDDVTIRMAERGALTLVGPDGTGTFLVPRPASFDGVDDLDSARLASALEGLEGIDVRYQHGVSEVREALGPGAADAGVLLRPATVGQIADNARSGRRMPPKTTFFHPKPRTGGVLRSTD